MTSTRDVLSSSYTWGTRTGVSAGIIAAIVREVARLDAVVELLAQPRRHLAHEVHDSVLRAPRGAGLDDAAELPQHREIDLDRFVDARALHLHDHDGRAVG